MTEYASIAEFLVSTDEVLDAAKSIVSSASNSHVYISGPFIKPIMDTLLSFCIEKRCNPHIFMVVPSITGRDYAGTSFLYYVNLLSERTRVNSRAYHNIIAGSAEMLMLSYYAKKYGEHSLTGVWLKDRMEAAKAATYCLELWNTSLPLRFGDR